MILKERIKGGVHEKVDTKRTDMILRDEEVGGPKFSVILSKNGIHVRY